MSGNKKDQSSIYAFFKPKLPQPSEPAPSSSLSSSHVAASATMRLPSHFPHPRYETPKVPVRSDENVKPMANTSQPTKTEQAIGRAFASTVFPSSSSRDISEASYSPPKSLIQPTPTSTEYKFHREVKGSDDEASDSDSSLEDLAVLLQSHRSQNNLQNSTSSLTPSTPIPSKATRSARLHTSPLPVLPRYKFNLKTLARLAQKDDATEASSKRVKAMLATDKETSNSTLPPNTSDMSKISNHQNLLESVIAGTEEGEVDKVTRALKRTEAILPEYQWYFFETQHIPSKPPRTPFPTASIPDTWHDEFNDPQMRYQAFVSGFAEDMVRFGKTLPDEIFMWMLDELCWEPGHALRNSYSGVLRASPSEQVGRLVVPSIIENVFQNVGGTLAAVSVSKIVQPFQKIDSPYEKQDGTKLRSVVKFLGQASKSLQQNTRIHALTMLIRMGIDRVVAENVDLYDLVQDAVFRLCRSVPEDSWGSCCQNICENMCDNVEKQTFRLQIVQTVPSTSPKTHDLRRRLAMCFYFNDISYAAKHSHHTMDLNLFIDRLDDEAFDAKPDTDYRELGALVSILDIAVDDARSVGLDLTDRKTESQFDNDIEAFSGAIKDVIRSIGNPSAGYISKIDCKDVLLLVSQRVGDTLRSRPKPRQTIWDVGHVKTTEESLDGERDFMKGFLTRRKGTTDANGA